MVGINRIIRKICALLFIGRKLRKSAVPGLTARLIEIGCANTQKKALHERPISCCSTFFRDAQCRWTNGYDFETALLLSVFLGMFGADRFYLGYPALGLLKFSTLGFFFLGHLLDIVLIASQVVGPADGSHYIIR